MNEYPENNSFLEFLPYLVVAVILTSVLYVGIATFNRMYDKTPTDKYRTSIDFLGKPLFEQSSDQAELLRQKQELLFEQRKASLRDQRILSEARTPIRHDNLRTR